MLQRKLEGRIALVTGGLRGIGRGIVEALAADGAMTIITDLDAEGSDVARTAQAEVTGATYRRLDVANEADWAAAAAAIETDYGHLDILVNNAGMELTQPVEAIALADWRRLMSVNLDGGFLGTRAFRSLLARGGQSSPAGSAIINVSSVLGVVAMGGQSAYCASKGGVRLFTKACALEFAEAGLPIRVNSVHPGCIETPMLRRGLEQQADAAGIDLAVCVEQAALFAPMRRMGQPIEIGRAVSFLASDDASYMTGSELVVDGGWSAR